MRMIKLLTPFFLVFVILFLLTACGTSLEKPSGLEGNENKQSEKRNEKQAEQKSDNEVIVKKSEKDITSVTDSEDEDELSIEVIEKDEKDLTKKETSKQESSSIDQKSTEKKTTSTTDTTKKSASSSSEKTDKSNTDKPKDKDESKADSKDTLPIKEKKENPPKQDKKPPKQVENPKEEKNTIVHSIVISTETNEVPLPPTELEIVDGDTVLEALIAITMKYGIHMDYRGGRGATAYIQGMGNVYEFDRGQGSGWMYRVNGVFPDRGAGVVPLCGGDRVEWLYTTNLGQDLGADLFPVRHDGECP